jgi:hypothetical protein
VRTALMQGDRTHVRSILMRLLSAWPLLGMQSMTWPYRPALTVSTPVAPCGGVIRLRAPRLCVRLWAL